jgi:UDP-N-acetylglucosamine--N-acetylmuramyl-(pentapeptide) pyrophosphoryl-undecaprenol N-acetylglucosamine transferase
VLISGGGTGGHVFPAIAIANALRKIVPDIDLHFIGAKGRLEMQKVPEAGYAIDGLWISGFQRENVFKNILLPLKIISSLVKARSIIRQFRPHVMVGVGGYASGPAMYMAAKYKIPVLIQEQNSYPGVTNRMMAGKAEKFCVAYDGMEIYFPKEKIVKTGNPVRDNIINIKSDKPASLRHFGLSEGKKVLLVIGGSLGARTINQSVLAGVSRLLSSDIQVIWQTGKIYYKEIVSAVPVHPGLKIFDFIKEMDKAYDAADIIISRAGAIAISELCVVKKPVILVPSPNVAEDHQNKNADALARNGAAWVVRDSEAVISLVDACLKLSANLKEQIRLSENIAKMAQPDAAARIAREVLLLAGAYTQ